MQRRLGLWWGVGAILVGTMLSATFAPTALVVASASAFLLSEFADLLIYTPLQRRGLVRAVLLSSVAGLVFDSIMFLARLRQPQLSRRPDYWKGLDGPNRNADCRLVAQSRSARQRS